jgi:hypothetical protein
MVIIATEEGIEVDGILLSNTAEMQTFINVHAPKDLPVGISAHAPIDLMAHLFATGMWNMSDLYAMLSINAPVELDVNVTPIVPHDVRAHIEAHQPFELEASLKSIPAYPLYANIDWIVHHQQLDVDIGGHIPHDLRVLISMLNISDLSAFMRAISPKDLDVRMKIYQRGMYNLEVLSQAVHTQSYDLLYEMYVWGARDLSIKIGGNIPYDLTAFLQPWHTRDISAVVETVYPKQLEINFIPQAEPGQDLLVIHRTYQKIPLMVSFNVWTGLKTLDVSLYGLYAYDFNVNLSMGSYKDLHIDIPMNTGYQNLFVTIKPATRIMSTIITIHTMEIKDLYVSLNQGWPCGFWSTYSLLNVTLRPTFCLNLDVSFKTIWGSGYISRAAYINKSYFDAYMVTQNLQFSIPTLPVPADAIIVDKVDIVYENKFDDIVQDVIQVRFPWPRFRRALGVFDMFVIITPYRGDKFLDFMVELYAVKPDIPTMPASKPLVQRQGLDEPVWPEVFQVKEIELWSEDSSEIVRKIEVMFGEQIQEYYWVSQEQRAYSKNAWEQKWTLLNRGYLPHSIYSGQIDYVTLREISDMKNFDTIDQAMKALISNFLYHDKTDLQVMLAGTGTYSNLSVQLDIRGRDRIYNLRVYIEPMKVTDLTVTLNCV